MTHTERPIWRSDDERPNVILILTDQWRGDCLSVLGHPTVDTPNLDELAHRGVLFSAAYAACPTCITARVDVWRGRLIQELAERPEDGLTDGERLIAGKTLPVVRPPHR